jgi:hypothetical protein
MMHLTRFLVLIVILCGNLCCAGENQDKASDAILKKDGKVAAAAFEDAVVVNIRPEMRDVLSPIVAAIRYAENGSKGREYGILHKRVKPTYRSQAGWCSATVQKNWDRYIRKGGKKNDIEAFISFLGNKYCPIGVDNDPDGLNKHWVGNVVRLHRQIERRPM